MTMTLTGSPLPVDPDFNAPPANPLDLLQKWLERADAMGVNEPRAMVLSTVDVSGCPSSRVVLLKDCDEKGVTFGTSQSSTKAKEININPWAAGTLWWRETIQQINFRGRVTQLSDERSDKMFQERERNGQALTVISMQSTPLVDEQELRDKMTKLVNSTDKIVRPEKWHAYHLILDEIEFWQGYQDRFHKRLRYDLVSDVWQHQRLQP